MLDATIVKVALPPIGDDFDVSVSSLQWVLTGLLLALASLILLGGALGERCGRRKVFLIDTIWFAGASLLCGAAPNVDVLIGRVLRGSGRRCARRAASRSCRPASTGGDRAKVVGRVAGTPGEYGERLGRSSVVGAFKGSGARRGRRCCPG